MIKNIIIALLLIIVVGLTWSKFHHSSAKIKDKVLVQAEKVKVGEIPQEAHALGTLVAARNIELTSEVSGKIEKILFNDGTFVAQGTPLIQLDDKVYKAKAESDKEKLRFSEENYNRMLYLSKKGAASKQAIEQAQADLKEKKAAAEESQMLVQKTLILAPFNGILGKVKVDRGNFITPGLPLVTLVDTQNLRVEFNVSEKYLPQLRHIGQQVSLTTSSLPDKKFYGKVSYVAPVINTEDRTISVYADVVNQDNMLTSGMFMDVTLLLGNQKSAILVSAESLVPTIDGDQVFKIVDGKALSKAVIIGLRSENQVEVLKGLEPNDLIVIAGQQKLKDGTTVEIK